MKLPACLFKMKIIRIILIFLPNVLIECYAECSFDNKSSSGTLTSPNYPQDYDNGLDCTFTLRSPTGRPITLVFLDFNLGWATSRCSADYVQIQDGKDEQLGKLCGRTPPDPVLAMSGELIVHLHTTKYFQYKGFKAVYNDTQDCIQIIKADSGKITSPRFPDDYPNNALCMYYIQSVQGLRMKLTFTSFNIQNSASCVDDHMIIKDDIKASANRYGQFCGDELPLIPIVNTGILFIVFISNQLTTSNGFSAFFGPILDCSGHLNVSSGIIQSPNYPNEYGDNKDCKYRLSNGNNGSINVTFMDFQLEKSDDCKYDFVEIRTHGEAPEKLCGNPDVPFYRIISSNATIFFHSDVDTGKRGFNAIFNEITEPTETTEQFSISTRTETSITEPVFTSFETTPSPAVRLTTNNNASSIPVTNTPFLMEGQKEGKSSVPIIIGTVAGCVVLTVITTLLIYCYLRKRSSGKRHRERTFTNIHYSNVAAAGNVTYANGEAESCNVENEAFKTNVVDPDYDVAAGIPQEQTDALNNVSGEPEDDYVDQEDTYNILNVHPKKTGITEIFDRTTEGVYDSAAQERGVSDIGLYDHTPTSPDHEYDSTVIIQPRIDDVYN